MAVSKSVLLIAESVILSVATVICTSIQLDTQIKLRKSVGMSKWLLLGGAFFALSMTGIVFALAINGLGDSMSPQEFAANAGIQKMLLAVFPPYFMCNMLIKFSWLTFYYSLACNKWERYFVHVMQVIAAGFGISSIFVALMLVVLYQRSKLDTTSGVEPDDLAGPINVLTFFYFNASIMIATDVVMYLMPIWLLWKNAILQGRRRSINILFAMGGLVVLASIMRLVAVRDFAHGDNPSGAYALILFWAGLENHLGICVACAGACKQKSIAGFKVIRQSISKMRTNSEYSRNSFDMSARTQSKIVATTTTTIRTESTNGSASPGEPKYWFETGDARELLDEEKQ